MSMILRSSKRGQGLLEAIIGIGVIIAGTVGTITLVVATIKAGRSTNNQVVAVSLAREGIEVVRNIRDSNWLRIQANEDTDSLASGIQLPPAFNGLFDETNPKHATVPIFDQSNNAWTVGALPVNSTFTTPCPIAGADHECSDIYQNGGIFRQVVSSTLVAGDKQTQFNRLVTLNPICRVDSSPADGIPDVPASETIANIDGDTCASSGKLLVGLQVVSTIQWTDGGQPKSLVLEDRLYNWKYVK